jgi:hypothetical protein
MNIFDYLITICNLTLVSGFIITMIISIPGGIVMALYENKKVFIISKIIKTIIVTSIIAFYILSYTTNKDISTSFFLYCIGFYSYLVIFTLVDETERETIQQEQRDYADRILLKATTVNKYLWVIALIYFILSLFFPIITHFYIPYICLKGYNWLMNYKLLFWIINIIGGLSVIYILYYSIVILVVILRGVINLKK